MLFDTHTHMLDERYDEDRDSVMKELPQKNVCGIVENASDLETSYLAVEFANKYDFVYATVGLHPHSASEWDGNTKKELTELAKNKRVVAIGEIGLDYYYDHSERDVQREVFCEQMQLAKELDLPVVIHSREATKDVVSVLEQFPTVSGVIHCFSGSVETMEIMLNMGYYIAFGGSLTFKNAKKTVEVAKCVPSDKILIETDCPYLTPIPYRGKRNTPEYVSFVAQKLAEVRNVSVEEIEDMTLRNAKMVFGI